MNEILVFGGSFNPPQNGHVTLINGVLKYTQCKKLLIIPSADRRDKVIGVSGIHRLKMVQNMCKECFPDVLDRIEISESELERNKPSTTYETEQELKKLYPDARIVFVVGADVLGEIRKKWVNGEELYQHTHFLAFPRGGFSIDASHMPIHTKILQIPDSEIIELSSTEIREKVKRGESIADFIPSTVALYIKNNNLYK